MATHSNTLAWVNSMDRGAWRVTVHGVTKSQTRLRKHTQFLQNRECKKVKRERESVSHSVMSNSVTPLVEAHQAPLFIEFSRQYWSGLPFPSPGDHPNPGIELWSPALQADSLPTEPPGKPCEYSYEYCKLLFECLGSS